MSGKLPITVISFVIGHLPIASFRCLTKAIYLLPLFAALILLCFSPMPASAAPGDSHTYDGGGNATPAFHDSFGQPFPVGEFGALQEGYIFGSEETTPPTAEATHLPFGPNTSDKVTFNIKASDNIGVTQLALYVDGVEVKVWNYSPGKFSTNEAIQLGPYAVGRHTYYAKAWDAAGLEGVSATGSFDVAPSPTLEAITLTPAPTVVKK